MDYRNNAEFIKLKNKVTRNRDCINSFRESVHRTRTVLISLYLDIRDKHKENGELNDLLGLKDEDFYFFSGGSDKMEEKARKINMYACHALVSYSDDMDKLQLRIDELADKLEIYSPNILDNLADYIQLSLGQCMIKNFHLYGNLRLS